MNYHKLKNLNVYAFMIYMFICLYSKLKLNCQS